MIEEEHAQIGKTFGPAAANNAMRVLRAAFNYIARDADLQPDPVRLREYWFDLPRREGRVRATICQVLCGGAGLPNPVARDYILLMLLTGLRRREAASLRWDDVDFASGVIRLPAARTKPGGSSTCR